MQMHESLPQPPVNPVLPSDGASRHYRFENQLDQLEGAMQACDVFLEEQDASPKLAYAIRLAFEELGTNIIKYGFDDNDTHIIEVSVLLSNPTAMTLIDDGHKFNPLTDAPAPMLDGELEDRPIGGLGLHMIRQMGMQLEYTRDQNRNILRVIFPGL